MRSLNWLHISGYWTKRWHSLHFQNYHTWGLITCSCWLISKYVSIEVTCRWLVEVNSAASNIYLETASVMQSVITNLGYATCSEWSLRMAKHRGTLGTCSKLNSCRRAELWASSDVNFHIKFEFTEFSKFSENGGWFSCGMGLINCSESFVICWWHSSHTLTATLPYPTTYKNKHHLSAKNNNTVSNSYRQSFCNRYEKMQVLKLKDLYKPCSFGQFSREPLLELHLVHIYTYLYTCMCVHTHTRHIISTSYLHITCPSVCPSNHPHTPTYLPIHPPIWLPGLRTIHLYETQSFFKS